jgi:ABC-type polysaccharide/polyol phosphate export permease
MQTQATVKAEGFELRGTVTPLRVLFGDLWEKRALIRLLARRDFHVRYRRATFGLVWVVAVPVIQATVLSIIFSRIVRVQIKTSYPVFMLSGLLPWLFFAMTVTAAVTAITGGSGLAAKVYFPRAILPLVVVRSNFYGFGLRLLVVLAAALLFGVGIGTSIVLIVPAVALMLLLSAAFSLVFAGLQVYFRDVNFIVTATIQAWFWGSAVFYPITLVPEGPLRTLMRVNPATGMVSLFRSAIIRTAPDWSVIGYTGAWIAVLLVVSAFLYRRFDRVFTDLL